MCGNATSKVDGRNIGALKRSSPSLEGKFTPCNVKAMPLVGVCVYIESVRCGALMQEKC